MITLDPFLHLGKYIYTAIGKVSMMIYFSQFVIYKWTLESINSKLNQKIQNNRFSLWNIGIQNIDKFTWTLSGSFRLAYNNALARRILRVILRQGMLSLSVTLGTVHMPRLSDASRRVPHTMHNTCSHIFYASWRYVVRFVCVCVLMPAMETDDPKEIVLASWVSISFSYRQNRSINPLPSTLSNWGGACIYLIQYFICTAAGLIFPQSWKQFLWTYNFDTRQQLFILEIVISDVYNWSANYI